MSNKENLNSYSLIFIELSCPKQKYSIRNAVILKKERKKERNQRSLKVENDTNYKSTYTENNYNQQLGTEFHSFQQSPWF